MSENGEEKLIAVARHIAKTLGHTNTMTDDILKIYSNFDGRLREKLNGNIAGEDVERTLNSLHRQISRYISDDRGIWSLPAADSSAFLDSVDKLIAGVRHWTPLADGNNYISSYLDRAEYLLQQCMFRLGDEFRTLVERGGKRDDSSYSSGDENDGVSEDDDFIPVASPVTDYNIVIKAFPAATIGDLHEIAKRMVAAGYTKECSHAYSTSRRKFLEESLYRLGLEKLSIDEVQKMQWTQVEDEIEKWVKAMKVALRILFPSERRLCDLIFSGFSSASDLSFMDVCRGSIVQLLSFADGVAIGCLAPERLFKMLDVYETLRDLMPEFELIFADNYSVSLRNEAITTLKRLGQAIRGIFMELENSIRQDLAKAAVPGGGLHPITRYVMNYLRAACRSRQTLEQIFDESVVPPSGNIRKGDDRNSALSSCSLAVQMAWIMELLESNLEAKSRIYKDSALCSVFMMNNGRYIVQKVKDSELGMLLGDDWIRKHMAKIRHYHVNYQRNSWSKILGVLKVDNSSMSPKNLREKLKLFSSNFEDTRKAQSSWVIFDEQLREELRVSVSEALAPAYRNFVGKLQSVPDFGKHADRYVRYSMEDLEVRVSELFQGRKCGRRFG